MIWDKEVRVLQEHGLTYGDWAILITAGYYIPLAGDRFIEQAVWESLGRATLDEVRKGYDHCLSHAWIKLVPAGHQEHERNVFGEKTGDVTEYPENGIVLTDSGHHLWASVGLALFGSQYFRNKPDINS